MPPAPAIADAKNRFIVENNCHWENVGKIATEGERGRYIAETITIFDMEMITAEERLGRRTEKEFPGMY